MNDNLETTAMRPFKDGDRVAFYGDSITRNGEAITRTAAYYRRAFQERKVRFFNVGISGGTVSAAHLYFDKWLAPLRPTHVVLAFGVNDAGGVIVSGDADDLAAERRRADDAVARFESEYERLIDRIQTLGAKVALRTPTPYDEESSGRDATPFGRGAAQERMANSVRGIAQRRSIPLVDDYAFLSARLAAGEQLFGNDHVHPNEKGQWWLSENLLRAQGLEAGAFRPFAEVAAEAGLAAWHETALALTYIPSTEWLIMHGEALSLDQQLAKVRKWLDDSEGKDGTNPAVVRFAYEYLRHKPREEELRTEEEEAFEMVRGTEWPGFSRGMGIGGWLTNYKRFNVLPEDKRLLITEGDLEHFDSYITEADVANIASMGVDHIRLGFDQIVLEEAPGRWRERTFGRIDAFVDWCGKYGLNLVLNLHKAVGNYCDIAEKVQLLDDDSLQRRFIDLWIEMERRYHDQPGIAFELLNEVRDVPAEKWNDLADRAIRTIRAMNPNRWIVIGSTCWNSPGKLKDLKVWDDPRVVYTFHMYAPFEFTHQRGVLQAGPMLYNRAMPYPTQDVERYRGYHRLLGNANAYPGVAAIDSNLLREFMRGAREFIKAHPGKILWNGEFGTIRHANPAWRLAYMRDVIAICREWGIPYCVWNYLSTPNDGNRFSLVDDDTRKLLIPVFATTD